MAKNTIGNLHIEVDIALQKMQSQLDQMGRRVKSATKKSTGDFTNFAAKAKGALATLGVGLSVGAFTSAISQVINYGSKITDLATQTNTSTDAFQALAVAAKDAGVEQEQLANSLNFLRKSISETAAGTGEAREAFKGLGVDARALSALPVERALEVIAKATANAEDKATAFGFALDILGSRNAPKLQEVLDRLAKDGVDKLSESMKGLIITPEQLATLDAAGDKIERMKTSALVFGAIQFNNWYELFGALKEGENTLDQMVVRMRRFLNLVAVTNPKVRLALAGYDKLQAATAKAAEEAKELADADDPLTSVAAARKMQLDLLKADARREAAILAERVAAWEESRKAFQKAVEEQTKESSEGFDAQVKAIDDYAVSLAEAIDPTIEIREEMQLLRDAMADGAVGAEMGAQRMAQLNHELDLLNPSMQELRRQAEETQEALDLESDSLLEFSNEAYDAVNPTNELARAMDNVRRATEAGFLDPETGEKYIQKIKESLKETEKATDAAEELGNVFASAFEDAIVNGGKFKEVLRGLAQDITRLFLRKQVSAPIANWFSAGFEKLFGGPNADGGPVDPSKWYLVGEEGPEAFIPDSSGTIIPAAQTNMMREGMGRGSEGGTYYIDARGADKEGLNKLEAMIYALNGSIEPRALAAVIDNKRRRTPGMNGAFA